MKRLLVSDVPQSSHLLALSMQTSKTDKFKECKIRIFIPKLLEGHELCPTASVLSVLRKTRAVDSEALFSFREGDRLRSFSANRFNSILQSVSCTAGISSGKTSTHSFRRRGATFASEFGVPADTLKAPGNWRSDCYARYISREEQLRAGFSFALAFAIPLSLLTSIEKGSSQCLLNVSETLAASRSEDFPALFPCFPLLGFLGWIASRRLFVWQKCSG